MHRLFHLVGRELREAVPPTIFFLLLFHLLALTKSLILESYDVTVATVSIATIGALMVAKAILISDKLPWVHRFSGKPLLLVVLWRTAIYTLLCFVFRLIEELVPLVMKYGGATTAIQHLWEEISWPHFWAIQIWLLVALAVYAAVVALDGHLGAGSLRRAFLHSYQPNANRP